MILFLMSSDACYHPVVCAETSLHIQVQVSIKLRSQRASLYTPATALSVDREVGQLVVFLDVVVGIFLETR